MSGPEAFLILGSIWSVLFSIWLYLMLRNDS